jgi:hypothetical protein
MAQKDAFSNLIPVGDTSRARVGSRRRGLLIASSRRLLAVVERPELDRGVPRGDCSGGVLCKRAGHPLLRQPSDAVNVCVEPQRVAVALPGPAEQSVDRLVGDLAEDIPQRLLDGADRAEPDFGRVLAVASLGRWGGAACQQRRGELDDVAGVAAAQLGLDDRETIKRPQARRACSQPSRLYRNVPASQQSGRQVGGVAEE